MQTLCKSDYQDVYRIKDGVILLVNKFDYIHDNDGYRRCFYPTTKNSITYASGCRDLKKVTDRIEGYNKTYAEVGQVLYHGYPVKLIPKKNWDYQIKITGDMFSGNSKEMIDYIDDIVKIIAKGD